MSSSHVSNTSVYKRRLFLFRLKCSLISSTSKWFYDCFETVYSQRLSATRLISCDHSSVHLCCSTSTLTYLLYLKSHLVRRLFRRIKSNLFTFEGRPVNLSSPHSVWTSVILTLSLFFNSLIFYYKSSALEKKKKIKAWKCWRRV